MTLRLDSTDSPAAPARAIEVIARPWLRRLISFGLLLHLSALVIAPLAVSPTSPLWLQTWRLFRPYLEAMNLGQGNHFFAPDPGPSHLIHFELRFDDGRTEHHVIPNVRQHWSRLRYHRHFMLCEFLNQLAINDRQRDVFDAVTRSYAEHLRHKHHASEVQIAIRRHYVPSLRHITAGKRLDDISLFAERPLGTFGAERR